MPGPGDLILVLDALELHLLDNDWVRSIWTEKFTTCPEELPDEYNEKFSLLNAADTIEVLKACPIIIKNWLESDSTSRISGSVTVANWTALQEVPYQNLLALLFFYTSNGFAKRESRACIELGINAAEVYLSLLTIPGSNVYNIFQISIFESCLKIFTITKYLNKISFGRNGRNFDNEDGGDELTASDERLILKAMNHYLIRFKAFAQSFSFKTQLEALSLSLTILTELTRCERQVSLDEFLRNNDKSTFTLLSKNAFLTLKELCAEMHGRDVVRLVLYHLLPNFSLVGGSSYPEIAKWSSKEHSVMRNLALWFIKTQIVTMGESCHRSVKTLIEYLTHNMIDRAEYRAKATDLLISIISLLPEKPYFSTLKWIFLEAFNDNASQRVAALELLSKLIFLKQGSVELSNMGDSGHSTLTNSSRSHLEPSQMHLDELSNPSSNCSSDVNTEATGVTDSSVGQARILSFCKPIEYVPIEYRRMMLAIIIDRFQDSAATVRAKAFSALSDILSNRTSPTIQKLIRSIFVDPYRSGAEINLTCREPEFIACADFRAALEKPDWSAVNKTMIPGATRVVQIIIKRCLDDKVHVRKAALTLLSHIFKLNSQWMTTFCLQHFGQHCRDPALSIRKEMLNMVTDLMLYYPNHSALTRMWVQEVVPQVADREIRVQENALNVLTKTILVNIKPLSRTVSGTDALPWQLLTQIAALKNRIFLTKACQLWRDSRTPELNETKIASVISHIGSAQDAACWVMLASHSEYVDIAKAQPIMDHYLNSVAKGESNLSVSYLVLVTLNNCCHKLAKESKIVLESQLLESLQNPATPPSLVPLLVKVIANLRHLLAENEQQAKKELAKWTLETVQDCERIIEASLNSDQVADTWETSLYHLTLLGCLSDLHPNQISQSTVECILKFLNAYRPMQHAGIVKLQASSIITLGRIALKLKSIANSFVQCLTNLLTHCCNPTILNNVVVSIADVGERYPNLIEPFISSLSMCLKHRSRDVRKTSLEITIDLLQEDYLRARGALIFNLMTLIHDPMRQTSATVKAYLTNCYFPKIQSPENVLLQAMFHYNKLKGHHSFNRIEVSPGEAAAFNFSGPKMHGKRLAIYRFLLSRVTTAFRHRCFHQVGEAILSDIALKNINVATMEGVQLVLDTFGLLLSRNLKGDASSKNKGDDDDEGEEAAQAQALQSDPFTQVFLKLVMAKVLKMRRVLFKHPRLHERFYFFVRELVRDHKSDIDELFKDDRHFGSEILHEINKYPKAEWDEEVTFEENHNRTDVAEAVVDEPTRKRKSDEHLPEEEVNKRSKESVSPVAHEMHNRPPEIIVNAPSSVEGRGDSSGSEKSSGSEIQENNTPMAVDDPSQNSDELPSISSITASSQILSKEKQPSIRLVRLSDGPSATTSQNVKGAVAKEKKIATSELVRLSGEQLAMTSQNMKEKSMATLNVPAITGKKRRVRAASDNLDNSDVLGIMLPPSRPSRISRRNASTPTVSNRRQKVPLFSSTPLVTKPKGFDATDISPVAPNSMCGEDEES